MSAAYDSLMTNLAVIDRKMNDQNTIIRAQKEELAKARLLLGHAQERVESLERELKYRDEEMLYRLRDSDANWVFQVWLRCLGGKCYRKSHMIDGIAKYTREIVAFYESRHEIPR